ncbi:methyl-accepting chemotaxis protein [Anaerobacillus sp. MEB173]|uniref:methyl-accepting chemotaxis protein n=1 Tax=Anaerobacillus sp. MEB173 TaxID=3383345 RepID=UPI003F93C341
MNKTLTGQLGIIIVCIIFLSMIITSISNYLVSYSKTYEAAGIEAVGCANITTGLIDPNELGAIIRGEKDVAQLQQTLDWTTDHKQIFETQYVLLEDGMIVVGDTNLERQGFKAGDQFYIDKDAIELILKTRHPQYSEIYEYGGMKRITGYAPIFQDHDPTKEIIAFNAIDFNAEIVSERTWASVKDSFLLGLLPMAVACLLTIWFIRRKTKPITMLIDYAKALASGDLAAEKVTVKNKDEIGELAANLHHMADNFKGLIEQIGTSAEQVAASAEQLTASAEQNNSSAIAITTTVQEVGIEMDRQVQSIEETSSTVDMMSGGVQQIARHAKSVSQAAVEATEKAAEGGQSIHTAVQQMNSINSTFDDLSDVVKGLGKRSEQIGQIIEVITEIAKQTNLLALNAAIEAARAGEHGRGFAIVADEVRKLAERSAQSADKVSEIISMIQVETEKTIQSMEIATNEVSSGIKVVNTAGESFQEIEHSVNNVTSQIQEVSTAVQQISDGSEQIVQSIQFISRAAEQTASGTQEVSSATEEQLASMEEISSSAQALARMADQLNSVIAKFKV